MTEKPAPTCPPLNGLKLIVGKYQLNFPEKRPICVTLPGAFKIGIIIVPGSEITLQPGDATVKQKDSCNLTICGDNSEDVHKIAVTVSGVPDPEGDGTCDFWIDVKDVGRLDPKVRVIGDQMMSNLHADAVYDLLDTLDISLEDVNKLRPSEESK